MGGVTDRFRRPEYTGENRCLPCTVVNGLLAAVAGAAVLAAGVAADRPAVGVAAGTAVLGGSAAAVWLRGYLIPGTPALTRRYFPAWLLAAFGKHPAGSDVETEVDPETALRRVGALEPCPDRDDLCLSEGFRADWLAAVPDPDAVDHGRVPSLLGLDGDAETETFGEAVRVRVDGVVLTWESRVALAADVGAAGLLADRHGGWERLSPAERGQLLAGLRVFLDRCPACAGPVELGAETVESCCSSREVAVVACPDCETRLLETAVA